MRKLNYKEIGRIIMKVLCIGAPVAGVLLLLLNRTGVITLGGSFIPYLLFLLCPLSHFLMMFFMTKEMNRSEAQVTVEGEQKHTGCH